MDGWLAGRELGERKLLSFPHPPPFSIRSPTSFSTRPTLFAPRRARGELPDRQQTRRTTPWRRRSSSCAMRRRSHGSRAWASDTRSAICWARAASRRSSLPPGRAARRAASSSSLALKVIEKSTLDEDEEAAEALVQEVTALRHAFAAAGRAVPKVHEVLDASETVYVVMDQIAGCELFELLEQGPMNEPSARRLVAQLLSALTALHRHHVIHRDVKPENLMVDHVDDPRRCRLVLIDFGYAALAPRADAALTLVLPEYAAPEVLSWLDGDGTPTRPRYAERRRDRVRPPQRRAAYDFPEEGLESFVRDAAEVGAGGVSPADAHERREMAAAVAFVKACMQLDPRRALRAQGPRPQVAAPRAATRRAWRSAWADDEGGARAARRGLQRHLRRRRAQARHAPVWPPRRPRRQADRPRPAAAVDADAAGAGGRRRRVEPERGLALAGGRGRRRRGRRAVAASPPPPPVAPSASRRSPDRRQRGALASASVPGCSRRARRSWRSRRTARRRSGSSGCRTSAWLPQRPRERLLRRPAAGRGRRDGGGAARRRSRRRAGRLLAPPLSSRQLPGSLHQGRAEVPAARDGGVSRRRAGMRGGSAIDSLGYRGAGDHGGAPLDPTAAVPLGHARGRPCPALRACAADLPHARRVARRASPQHDEYEQRTASVVCVS